MNTDLRALLAPIHVRLAAATPGPWRIENDSEQDYEHGIPYSEWPQTLVGPEQAWPSEWAKANGETRRVDEINELRPADAELIANAPTDLARLLAAIEAGITMLDERAQAFRETATRLNRQVIDRAPDRDAAAAKRYSHYASQVESTAYAFRRTVAAALGSDTTNQEGQG